MRTLARWAVPAVVVLGAIGCADAEDPPEASEATTPATVDTGDLCVRFPLRDAGALFAVPSDPELAGDPAAAHQLLELAARGLPEAAPATIRPAVDTYAAALRRYQPGTDPLADEPTRSAVVQINRWLQDNCPPPPATTP